MLSNFTIQIFPCSHTDGKESPKLRPYPNWESHQLRLNDTPQIVSSFRVRADKCDRLWALDVGADDLLGQTKNYTNERLLIFDLHNDQLLRTYEIPEDQIKKNMSFFQNLAVEDTDCEDTYAYLADVGHPAIVVYSWKKGRSWLIKHNFFNINPLVGPLNVSGVEFNNEDGIYGLALSGPDKDGFSTLYFHPFTSYNEFQVSTRVLRNETADKTNFYYDFKLLGSRGKKAQSGASFLDPKTNVLFYSLVNLNAVACWKTTNPAYTMESQGRIFMSDVSMVYPNDIKVDSNDNLWVLSNRLPIFLYSRLNYDDVNFRILMAKVTDAIRGTACDVKFVLSPKIVDKIMPVLNLTTITKSFANYNVPSLIILTICICLNAILY